MTGVNRHTRDPAPGGVTGYNPVKLDTSAGVVNDVRSNGGAPTVEWDDLNIWKVR